MEIHIGEIIKTEAKRQGLSNVHLFEITKVKNPQNIDYDLKQKVLPLDKLELYTKALNHNFLKYYYEEEPFKTFREEENKTFLAEISLLNEQVEEANKTVAMQEYHLKTQQELIETQRALIAELKG
ncbi:hypothetical protein ACFX5U_20440 [Sphingobacterium sp. SG20118]|uniref:hypothetical protein n=1 Tax=Sphingobacterium sp. SG20118 TaxID=3367156 RepID=UPI0037DFC53D